MRSDELVLDVHIEQAKGLVVTDPESQCHPMVLCSIFPDSVSRKTARIKNTLRPEWGAKLKFPLRGEQSRVLDIVLYDEHRRRRDYMGEIRLCLRDVVGSLVKDTKGDRFRSDAVWYQLYSCQSEKRFISGSVSIWFELRLRNKKVAKRLEKVHLNEAKSEIIDAYKDQSSRMTPEIENDARPALTMRREQFLRAVEGTDHELTTPNDQGFYPDWRVFLNESEEEDSTDKEEANFNLTESEVTEGYTTESEKESGYDSSREPKDQASSLSHLRISRNRKTHYELSMQRQVLGILFIEIVSAHGLPPFKSATRTGFDMDPFVLVSFGRQVFRTSWRKHTLKPIFNERLAFEVLPEEEKFTVAFSILDKDHFSYHDKVAFNSVPIRSLIHTCGESQVDLVCNTKKLPKKHREKTYEPVLNIRVRFDPYETVKRQFWKHLLQAFDNDNNQKFDVVELSLFFHSLGSSSDVAEHIFHFYKKSPWVGDMLTTDQVIEFLEKNTLKEKILRFDECPFCHKSRLSKKQDLDILVHVSICASKDWSPIKKVLKPSYASQSFASKRWYSKLLIKLVYGKYALGKDSANILVQDRDTGLIIEEKMSSYVRLGIRLLYRSFDKADSRRVKRLMRRLSHKQGKKFDSAQSKSQIASFIKFHNLDLSECLLTNPTDYSSFNDFFYRTLQPNARPVECLEDGNIMTSPADSRCTAFDTVDSATQIWIKGRNFTLPKMLGPNFDNYNERSAIGVFRLAPQDYHRFHSPVAGTVGKPVYISGEYFTVNPMAVRSELDIFGENVRCIIPVTSASLGRVLVVAVGAMMVGSILLTCEEGRFVEKGQELGYFKFGGSTIVVVVPSDVGFLFDSDLVKNSTDAVETLVKVGQSVGHHSSVPQHLRTMHDFEKESPDQQEKIINTITGAGSSWDEQNLELDALDELDGISSDDGE